MLVNLSASRFSGRDCTMVHQSLGGCVFKLHGPNPACCFEDLQKVGPTQVITTEGKSSQEIKNEVLTKTKPGILLIISGGVNVEMGFLLKTAKEKKYSIIFHNTKIKYQ